MYLYSLQIKGDSNKIKIFTWRSFEQDLRCVWKKLKNMNYVGHLELNERSPWLVSLHVQEDRGPKTEAGGYGWVD
jgi:hypothetical protein